MKLDIPFLAYQDVAKRAQYLLEQYHPSLELPIPIEEIVELKIGLDIFPFPRLYKDHKLSGFLSRDRSTIYVDEIQFDQFNEKFRFTLAHELGHYVLHKSCYENLPFKTPDDYTKWRMAIAPEDISWFETHGNWFAGRLLVPTIRLEEICVSIVAKYQDTFSKFRSIPEDIWSYISNEVARYFEVNPQVVETQIKKENIPNRIPIRG